MSNSTFRLSGRAALGTALVTCFALASTSLAAVRLHPLFTDHAVLQQGLPVPVWGTAAAGEKVTVEFAGQKAVTVAGESGHWRITLGALNATTRGATLKATGQSQSVEITDVVVGEVWLCSGQSNMEFPLKPSFNSGPDIAASANPNLRLFTVTKRRSPVVKTDLDYAPHAWSVAGPETTPGFSAVGYYFGRDLEAALRSKKVPVGLIHTSWGGSPAEVWMSEDALKASHVYARDILAPHLDAARAYRAGVTQWEQARAAAEAKGETFTQRRPGASWEPAELYNGMIANLIPYAIKGAIWYQGESNAGRAWQYRSLFADMIRNWRRDWGQGDFYFYAVQLAPWDMNRKRDLSAIAAEVGDSSWAELREAQNVAAANLSHAGIAVITDVGDKDDIHPTRKGPVGARLARLARAQAYGENLESTGPAFVRKTVHGAEITVVLSHAAGGLKSADRMPLTGFTMAGADQKFHHATARVSGRDQLVVSSPEVTRPVAVRYGWADYPVVNLANGDDLPATPFRTDHWELTTQKIK